MLQGLFGQLYHCELSAGRKRQRNRQALCSSDELWGTHFRRPLQTRSFFESEMNMLFHFYVTYFFSNWILWILWINLLLNIPLPWHGLARQTSIRLAWWSHRSVAFFKKTEMFEIEKQLEVLFDLLFLSLMFHCSMWSFANKVIGFGIMLPCSLHLELSYAFVFEWKAGFSMWLSRSFDDSNRLCQAFCVFWA